MSSIQNSSSQIPYNIEELYNSLEDAVVKIDQSGPFITGPKLKKPLFLDELASHVGHVFQICVTNNINFQGRYSSLQEKISSWYKEDAVVDWYKQNDPRAAWFKTVETLEKAFADGCRRHWADE